MNNYIEPDYEEYVNGGYKDYTYNHHHHRVAIAPQNQHVNRSKQPGQIERQDSLLSGKFHMLL